MRKINILFFFMVICINAQVKMNDVEAKTLRSLVKTQAENTKTVTSDFVQYQHIDFLENDIESSGKFAFKAPSMVRWEYVTPDPNIILFKNEKLHMNQNGKKSSLDMGTNAIFKQLNQLITASVKGDMFDVQRFDITYYKKQPDSEVHFKLKDSDFAEFIQAIHINFNKKGEVIEVKMLEPTGDYTKIVFKNRIANQPIPDTVFVE